MASLYEIDQRILNYKMEFDEDGVWINEDEWESIKMDKEDKIEATALVVKDKEAFLDALKKEKSNIEDRIKACANEIDKLKERIGASLVYEKFETPKVKITYRKSEPVVIPDEALVPDRYVNLTVVRKPVKDNIKKYLKELEVKGEECEWAHLEHKKNVNIK